VNAEISLPQYPPVKCVSCQKTFKPEMYVIVDVSARPDLVQRIREGILHCAICPHCAAVLTLGMPLLVYRPGEAVPLMYSPVAGATKSQKHEHGRMLLEELRHRIGQAWHDELASGGVYTVDRTKLAGIIDCNPDLLPGGRDPSLRRAMDRYLHCGTWEEARRTVEQNEILLSREAEIVLKNGIDSARAGGDAEIEATMAEHLDVLRQCRTASLEEAFAAKTDGSGQTIKMNLEAIYGALAKVPPDEFKKTAMLSRAALQRLQRQEDEETWADLQQKLGVSLLQASREGDTGDAVEAADHFQKALEVYSRDRSPEKWATLKRQLAEAFELTLRK
jgi:hypothetical protein